jgi:hypothetical protein
MAPVPARRVASVTCESCGAEESELTAVYRKYVTAATWDQEAGERVLPDIERWCFSCLTQYPHQPVDA